MKKIKLPLLFLSALLFYSCNQDDDLFAGLKSGRNGNATVCDNLTFETAEAGNYIDQISTGDGFGSIKVYARARNSDGDFVNDNRAMIFDSEHPTGDDADLYTTDWGKVLIIQELGEEHEPNDNRWGGDITLTFPEAVTVKSMRVLDVDNREGDNENNSWVYLYDASGKELHKVQLVPRGDNSKQTVDLGNTANVTKLKVVLDGEGIVGSAAIDNIAFCFAGENTEEEEKYGCTQLRTYWLDHSDPATEHYNRTWNSFAKTAFFNSGQTYLELLQRLPSKGNAYFMLAQPYITAKLNIKSGASTTPEVDEALAGATQFFKGETSPEVAQLLVWAALLDAYNKGDIGPGRCPEE
ncbi:hypothetical protein H7F15_17680 [Pontibacter sp. Tf4]|uniref:hypothetical protein n=1 Tax=Pontibacter sp. Tf4 TaxID=2761620 RepID=UPI00162ADF83|nr:hypothetical protein [Pontibacter sp. Tf4]MBB6612877.1 hypothetical protein [Pontibacter sp. Tf4]